LSATGAKSPVTYQHRVEHIAHALRGIMHRWGNPNYQVVFLHTFTDLMLLLNHEPCLLRITANAGKLPEFTNLSHDDIKWLALDSPDIEEKHIALDQRLMLSIKYPNKGKNRLDPQDVFAQMGDKQRALFQLLHRGLSHCTSLHSTTMAASHRRTLLNEADIENLQHQAESLLKPFHDRYTICLGDFSNSPYFTPPGGKPGPLNLFCVVQFALPEGTMRQVALPHPSLASISFPYTAALLPSESLERYVLHAWDHADLDAKARIASYQEEDWRNIDPIHLLRRPLGPGARSIADSVFMSGVADFGQTKERNLLRGRDKTPESGTDRARAELESLIYRPYTKSNYTIFYVPIHVGGCPWLALFRFCSANRATESDEAFWASYYFVRDVIPTLADRLRLAAEEAYAETLSRLLIEEIAAGPIQLAERINQKWLEASAVYPFHTMLLSSIPDNEDVIRMPDGQKFWLMDEPNRHEGFRRQVYYYDAASRSRVLATTRQALQLGLEAVYTSRKLTYHSTINALANINAERCINELCDGIPPMRLNCAIVPCSSQHQSEERQYNDAEQQLLLFFQRVWYGLEETRTLLTLGELLVTGVPLKKKFQATTAYRLSECLELAKLLLGVHLDQPGTVRWKADFTSLVFQPGYLKREFITGVILELLLNAVNSPCDTGWERAIEADLCAQDECHRLILRNRVRGHLGDWITIQGIAVHRTAPLRPIANTYLFQHNILADHLGSLKITTQPHLRPDGFLEYITFLELKPIRFESENGEEVSSPSLLPIT